MALTAALTAGVAASASAQLATITFAQVNQSVGGNPFVFTNSDPSGGGDGGVSSSFDAIDVPVTFQFLVPNPAGMNPIPGHLTLTSLVSAPATQASGFDFQFLKSMSVNITADTAIGGLSNLLEVVPNNGVSTSFLYGLDGGQTGINLSDQQSFGTFNFLSDFLSFPNNSGDNYAFSLSSLTASSSLSVNANGYFNGFSAAGVGTFGAIPEPTSLVLLGSGAMGLLWLARRRRAVAK